MRTVLDIDLTPDVTFTSATSVATWVLHTGIFVTEDDNPSGTLWSPNTPFGDFMNRSGSSVYWRREATADLAATTNFSHNGRRIHIDTAVRRKLNENGRLFLSTAYFESGAMNQLDLGWTGRVLVMLP